MVALLLYMGAVSSIEAFSTIRKRDNRWALTSDPSGHIDGAVSQAFATPCTFCNDTRSFLSSGIAKWPHFAQTNVPEPVPVISRNSSPSTQKRAPHYRDVRGHIHFAPLGLRSGTSCSRIVALDGYRDVNFA